MVVRSFIARCRIGRIDRWHMCILLYCAHEWNWHSYRPRIIHRANKKLSNKEMRPFITALWYILNRFEQAFSGKFKHASNFWHVAHVLIRRNSMMLWGLLTSLWVNNPHHIIGFLLRTWCYMSKIWGMFEFFTSAESLNLFRCFLPARMNLHLYIMTVFFSTTAIFSK